MKIDRREWDEYAFKDLFGDRDALLILSIPLSSNIYDDSWIWDGEKSGLYSIKSAYHGIKRDKEGNEGEDHSGFWRQLWRLKVPHKVKNLLWRVVLGCLPTKSQLHLKHVTIDMYCPSCNMVVESIYHNLVSYSFSQDVWGILILDVKVGDFEVFDVWLDAILQRFDHNRVGKITTVCWALWRARNNLVWNKKGVTVTALVTLALLCLENWTNAQDINFDVSIESLLPGDGSDHWVKPHENTIKVNIDPFS
ncbi:uncharacterized protein LOC133831980 [Humulus lupulus]|uniref:uncharacterized protein LOC133831980 n=1 Tax=Humulus lupulus TaxID=3486 RepID=UPI002B4144EA|nr:uncharacterized protein LOC133831980 [Humulus lupulus]